MLNKPYIFCVGVGNASSIKSLYFSEVGREARRDPTRDPTMTSNPNYQEEGILIVLP